MRIFVAPFIFRKFETQLTVPYSKYLCYLDSISNTLNTLLSWNIQSQKWTRFVQTIFHPISFFLVSYLCHRIFTKLMANNDARWSSIMIRNQWVLNELICSDLTGLHNLFKSHVSLWNAVITWPSPFCRPNCIGNQTKIKTLSVLSTKMGRTLF